MSERTEPARKRRAPRGQGWRNGGGAPPLLRDIGALLVLSPAERARLLAALSDQQCDEIFYDWSLWARDDQRPPPGDWIYWLILAGRGAGKTRAGAEAVREWAKSFAIVNLIGPTHDDVRDVMVLGGSGLMAVCPPDERPRYARASGRLAWPNGAVSLLFSAEEPDRLRAAELAPIAQPRRAHRRTARRAGGAAGPRDRRVRPKSFYDCASSRVRSSGGMRIGRPPRSAATRILAVASDCPPRSTV